MPAAIDTTKAKKRVRKRSVGKAITRTARPAYKPPQGDTKSAKDLGRAPRFKQTPRYKRDVEVVVRAQTPARRAKLVKQAKKGTVEHKVTRAVARELGHEAKDVKTRTDLHRGDRTKQSKDYIDTLQDVRAGDKSRKRQRADDLLTSMSREKAGPDRPRSDTELKTFLKTGERPQRLSRKDQQNVQKAEINAPVIKVLDQTLRPTRAIAGSVDAALHGENVPKAAKKGLVKNKGPLFGDVLKRAGAPTAVAAPAGFALDVVTDPTTYVTFGAAVPAKKAAQVAARKATADAAAKGASKKAANKAGRAAAHRVLNAPDAKARGVSIGARGHVPFTKVGGEVKTSGKTSAKIGQKTAKLRKRVRESAPAQVTGKELVHDFRPAGRTHTQHATVRTAERKLRAQQQQARKQGAREKVALRKAVGDADQRIIDKIESGRPLRELGSEAPVARGVRRMLGEAHDLKKSRGIGKTFKSTGTLDAQRYIPHQNKQIPKFKRMMGRTKAGKDPLRGIREPLSEVRRRDPDLFSEDLPQVVASHRMQARERAALSDFWKTIGKTGRPLDKRGVDDTEMVFRADPEGLTPLQKEGAPGQLGRLDKAAVTEAQRKGQKLVVLSRTDYEDIVARMTPGQSPTLPGRAFDRVQGTWKKAVTIPWPAYHARNLMGDTMNAYLGDANVRSFATANKVLKKQRGRDTVQRSAQHVTSPSKLSGDEARYLKEMEEHGVVGQGFQGRELPDLTGKVSGEGRFAKLGRASQWREDLPRAATYIAARRRGMNPSEAADWSLQHHFDYGDLTPAERQFRRAIPFYTFFARNTRLQAAKIVTRPGKQATLAKFLNETAAAAGFTDYESYAKHLPKHQQRGLAIPLKIGGKVKNIVVMPPTTDLNQLSLDPAAQAQNIATRITSAKLAVELLTNKSAFFWGPIKREGQNFSPAPSFVKLLPPELKKALGVSEYNDPRRGRILGWHPKWDYGLRALPGASVLFQALTPVPTSRQEAKNTGLLTGLTGARVTPFNEIAEDEKIIRLGNELAKVRAKADRMRDIPGQYIQGNKKKGPYVREYEATLDEAARLEEQLKKLKAKRGDDVEERKGERRNKKKIRKGGGGLYGGGSGGSSGGLYGK